MKVWVLTGNDVENLIVISGGRTAFDIINEYMDVYDSEDIEVRSTNLIIVGGFWMRAERVKVEDE